MSGRILIVDDIATNRIVLKVKLADARYETLLAADGAACLRMASRTAPDLILLDRVLPDLDGIEVLRRLRADPQTRTIPVIMTLAAGDGDARICALRAGADDVMMKPLEDERLMARLRALLRARDGADELRARNATLGAVGLAEAAAGFERPGLVALVTERPETAIHLRHSLAAHLTDHMMILSRDEALGEVSADPARMPDVYVIESDLGADGGGLRLMSDLRSRSSGRHAAICMIQPAMAANQAAMAFDLGANDVIAADADPCEIALRLRMLLRRKRHDDKLRATVSDGLRLAVIDPLTGLHNRRYALAQLGRMLERARRSDEGVAVMIIDLDRFKAVNDAFGHAAGDAVLVEVARRLSSNLRGGDLLARIGGEEFLVALPDTRLADATLMAQRLCRAVEEAAISFDHARALLVTVSIGLAVASLPETAEPEAVTTIVRRADHALLSSKAQGRNQVTISRSAA